MGYIATQTRDDGAWSRLATYPVPIPIERVFTAGEVARLAREPDVLALVVDLLDRTEQPMTDAVRTVRGSHPAIPILVWCPASALGSPLSRGVVGAGADAVVVQRAGPFEERSFAQLVPRGELRFSEWIDASIERTVAPGLRPVVGVFLHPGNAELTVPLVARRFGMARRTLTDHLSRAGLPTGRELLEWGSLLAAAWDLESRDHSVERVAHDHGFASASALRAALKRRAGQPPSAMRESGSFGWVLRCFERRIRDTTRRAGE